MARYYLGVRVQLAIDEMPIENVWVWAIWPDGRCFKHWEAQLLATPWGES